MKLLSAILLITTSTLLAACATDTTDDGEPADESASETADLTGWQPVEVDEAPSGTVFVAPMSPQTAEATTVLACPTGYACLFQNGNFRGEAVAVQSGIGIRNLRGIPCPGCTNGTHGNDATFNDQMTSWKNLTRRQYCWWFDAGPSGERHVMRANWQVAQVLARENDRASAFGPCQ